MSDFRSAPTGGDDLVELMLRLGVDVAFGVVSVHNLPLVAAVDRRLRFVPVRHEQAAVNAADGYGRVSGHLGVAITSTGTGAGNAAGALVESLTAGSAVLHVTGQIDSPYLGGGRGVIHETRDQLGMLTAVSKAAQTVVPGVDAANVLADVAAAALDAPRGPGSVEWPIDLQYRYSGSRPAAPVGSTPAFDERRLDEAVDLLHAARRPLIWAGGGATGARVEVERLLEATGAGLMTSNAGRGTLPEDDPRCVGNFGSSAGGAALLAEADALVTIGSHLRSNETRNYRLPLPRPHVQIDLDPAALGRVHPADVAIHGDAVAVVGALADRLAAGPARVDDAWVARVREVREAVRRDLREAIGPYAAICDAMRQVLPREAVVARDITVPSSAWGNRLLDIHSPSTNIYPRGGGIGQGLALGIGAATARPDQPTMIMVGDGGLVAQLGELVTLAQERPNCCVVIFDDRGYGVLRNMQDEYVGRRSGVDLVTPDFAALAGSLGLPHARVGDANDFGDAFADLVARPGPSILEVDMIAVGPMPRPFTPPVEVSGTDEVPA